MGIMNKTKTVDLRNLGTWQYDNSSGTPFFFVRGSNAKPLTQFISVKGYTQKDGFWRQAGNNLCVGVGSDSIAISNFQFSTVSSFLASEGDKTITYETIDSVEEEIMSRTSNLWDEQWEVVSGHIVTKNFIPCMPNTKYYIVGPVVSPQLFANGFSWYDKDKNKIRTLYYNSGLVTSIEGAYFFKFELGSAYGTTYKNDIAIIEGTTGVYEPFVIPEEIMEYDPLKPVMADNKWTDIFDAFKNDSAPATWQVGDTKSLTLTDNTTYTIRLCDKQAGRYQYSDGSGSSNAVFEFVELVSLDTIYRFQMNTVNTNEGGWASSYMRGTTIPNFETFLPDDVIAAISRVNVLSGTGNSTTSGTSSSANKLFLPAEMEMFSSKNYSIGDGECPLGQFDYYKAHDTAADKVKVIVGTTTAYEYRLRSPQSSSPFNFCTVANDGSASFTSGSNSRGVAYCFAI